MKYRYWWAWERWKNATDHQEKVQKGLNQAILNRLVHRVQHNAFTHWRRNKHILDTESTLASKAMELEKEAEQQARVDASRQQMAQLNESTSFKLEQIYAEQDYKKKQMVNMITRNI